MILLLTHLNCKKKTDHAFPKSQERFVTVYVALQKFRESYPIQQPVPLDSLKAILQKHGFTQEEYDRSLAYFNEKPERWLSFYREVLERLQQNEDPPDLKANKQSFPE